MLCGAQTDACITATMYGGIHRGYDVTLVEDAHTTDDTEFRGQQLPAELLVDHLVRAATYSELPDVVLTAKPGRRHFLVTGVAGRKAGQPSPS